MMYPVSVVFIQPRSSMLSDDANGNANRHDIYAIMRQSSGSNFFLNRKDHIVVKGYLNKKSEWIRIASNSIIW